MSGVSDGARTRDHRNHNPGLYQLSYTHHSNEQIRWLVKEADNSTVFIFSVKKKLLRLALNRFFSHLNRLEQLLQAVYHRDDRFFVSAHLLVGDPLHQTDNNHFAVR